MVKCQKWLCTIVKYAWWPHSLFYMDCLEVNHEVNFWKVWELRFFGKWVPHSTFAWRGTIFLWMGINSQICDEALHAPYIRVPKVWTWRDPQGSQSVIPKQAAAAPGNLLEMQLSGLTQGLGNPKLWGCGHAICWDKASRWSQFMFKFGKQFLMSLKPCNCLMRYELSSKSPISHRWGGEVICGIAGR